MSLGVTHEHLAGTPVDICKLEFSQFPVAKSSGGEQKQHGAIA